MLADTWQRLKRKGSLLNLLRILLQMGWVRFFSALYTSWLRLLGVQVGRGCRFRGPIEIIGDPRRIRIGDGSYLHPGVVLWTHDYDSGHGQIVLGRRVVCMPRVTLNSYLRIEVGDDSAFGDGCYIQDNDHGTAIGDRVLAQPLKSLPIAIGSDVWFGARCIVLKGVTVGDHAVVGAGSIVVRSLPAGMVAVGVPCRPVKRRGDDGADSSSYREKLA